MDKIVLQAKKRDLSQKAKWLRAEGKVPGVCYDSATESKSIEVDYHDLRKIYNKAGTNTIFELVLDGKSADVLIHDLQFDVLSNEISHVDFMEIRMDKPVYATVPLKFVGKSPAVSDLGGTLVHNRSEVEIKCLPKYLLHEIEVDVSAIVDFHTSIHISDLIVSEHVHVIDNPEEVIATVAAPKTEDELAKEEAEGGKEPPKEEPVAAEAPKAKSKE